MTDNGPAVVFNLATEVVRDTGGHHIIQRLRKPSFCSKEPKRWLLHQRNLHKKTSYSQSDRFCTKPVKVFLKQFVLLKKTGLGTTLKYKREGSTIH